MHVTLRAFWAEVLANSVGHWCQKGSLSGNAVRLPRCQECLGIAIVTNGLRGATGCLALKRLPVSLWTSPIVSEMMIYIYILYIIYIYIIYNYMYIYILYPKGLKKSSSQRQTQLATSRRIGFRLGQYCYVKTHAPVKRTWNQCNLRMNRSLFVASSPHVGEYRIPNMCAYHQQNY